VLRIVTIGFYIAKQNVLHTCEDQKFPSRRPHQRPSKRHQEFDENLLEQCCSMLVGALTQEFRIEGYRIG